MLRAFRFIVDLFTQRHGIVAFVFFLLVGLLMRQAPDIVKNSIVSTVLGTVFYPAQMVISSVDAFRSVAAENEHLKEENARLRQETYYASEGLQELARLHTLVRFDDKWDYPIVTARVVGHNAGRFLTTLVINRGTRHGVKENMPVFSMNGLVGKITKASYAHSRVQLLVDPNLKLSVLERRTRVVGFLESVDGHLLTAMVPTHAGVKEGDTLITSGLGGIFPKGIPVGTVKAVRESDLDVMRLMDVAPFQEFSTLEEVFVMEKDPEWIIQELLDE
ncbi:MAG: rod shape-determining protein MreC [Fibrobacter sp.]|uniref:rod shape-determining protein MreC n=1 Tax=Fibrobacter sp. UWP2 TaxID=1896216 RepID=UPI000913CCDA|nr:rod shape-determining protein MreC [Fibrobacter sp. UWP2]MBO7383059.1 rod shape-determining protein MreC [Fibrobacter sp.]SHI66628.1 rod shape-determining protein MreC [Fibrobacter sp. UWP2]